MMAHWLGTWQSLDRPVCAVRAAVESSHAVSEFSKGSNKAHTYVSNSKKIIFLDAQLFLKQGFSRCQGILRYLVLDYCSGGMAPLPDLFLVIISLAGLWSVM